MLARPLLAATLILLTPYCSKGGSGLSPDPRGSGADPVGSRDRRSSGEPRELAGITAAHNAVRKRVGVAPLVWDDRLAETARGWVRRCVDRSSPRGVIDHNADRSRGHSEYVGENLTAGTGPLQARAVVEGWVSEADDYDHARNRCRRGKVCGHYTQVVWAATERVGCAAFTCSNLEYPYTVLCNYGPAGNSGGRPY